jgi:hypothetical protein
MDRVGYSYVWKKREQWFPCMSAKNEQVSDRSVHGFLWATMIKGLSADWWAYIRIDRATATGALMSSSACALCSRRPRGCVGHLCMHHVPSLYEACSRYMHRHVPPTYIHVPFLTPSDLHTSANTLPCNSIQFPFFHFEPLNIRDRSMEEMGTYNFWHKTCRFVLLLPPLQIYKNL